MKKLFTKIFKGRSIRRDKKKKLFIKEMKEIGLSNIMGDLVKEDMYSKSLKNYLKWRGAFGFFRKFFKGKSDICIIFPLPLVDITKTCKLYSDSLTNVKNMLTKANKCPDECGGVFFKITFKEEKFILTEKQFNYLDSYVKSIDKYKNSLGKNMTIKDCRLQLAKTVAEKYKDLANNLEKQVYKDTLHLHEIIKTYHTSELRLKKQRKDIYDKIYNAQFKPEVNDYLKRLEKLSFPKPQENLIEEMKKMVVKILSYVNK